MTTRFADSTAKSADTSTGLAGTVIARVATLDWQRVEGELDARGSAVLPRILFPGECRALARLYPEAIFRSRVVMSRHGFGKGEYKYFDYPLPDIIQELRENLYPKLVPIANRWNAE